MQIESIIAYGILAPFIIFNIGIGLAMHLTESLALQGGEDVRVGFLSTKIKKSRNLR